jgi:hypothetical protein
MKKYLVMILYMGSRPRARRYHKSNDNLQQTPVQRSQIVIVVVVNHHLHCKPQRHRHRQPPLK